MLGFWVVGDEKRWGDEMSERGDEMRLDGYTQHNIQYRSMRCKNAEYVSHSSHAKPLRNPDRMG